MGLRHRMQDAGRRAGAAAKGVGGNARSAMASVKAGLDALPMPSAPVTEPWEASIGRLIRGQRDVPKLADKALGLLNRVGSVRVSPTSVGFDEDDVAWDKVVEVRTGHVLEHLGTGAIDREVDRIRSLLPPVPGRKWAVRRVAGGVMTLSIGAMKRVARDGRAPRPVPLVIVWKGTLGRRKEMVAGTTATALLAGLPAVGESICATARARGIPVIAPDHEPAVDPAAAEAEAAELAPKLDALYAEEEEEDGPDEA